MKKGNLLSYQDILAKKTPLGITPDAVGARIDSLIHNSSPPVSTASPLRAP